MLSKISLIIFLLTIVKVSSSYAPNDIKNPRDKESALFCGRPSVEHSSICDPDSLLTFEGANVIEGRLNMINELNTAEIAILIIKKMTPSFVSYRTKNVAAEKFAIAIHNEWGVGNKETNNGVVIFISTEDRVMYISTGKGVMNILTEQALDITLLNMKTYLRNLDYNGALEYAVTDISLLLKGEKKTVPSSPSYDGYVFAGFVALFMGIFASSHYSNRYKDQLSRGNAKLQDLMKEVKSSEDNKFQSKSCPICLEDLPTMIDEVPPSSSAEPTVEVSASLLLKPLLENRPMALKCGHVFCFTCLDRHLKSSGSHGKCPICRKSVDGTDSAASHQPRPPCNINQEQREEQNRTFRSTELLYRVQRMHILYPAVMTRDMRSSMEDSINSDDLSRLHILGVERVAAVQQTLSDMVMRQAASSSGARGSSSSSFGGGRSSGGRGGSW